MLLNQLNIAYCISIKWRFYVHVGVCIRKKKLSELEFFAEPSLECRARGMAVDCKINIRRMEQKADGFSSLPNFFIKISRIDFQVLWNIMKPYIQIIKPAPKSFLFKMECKGRLFHICWHPLHVLLQGIRRNRIT